jgi:vacuolar-type H+-ATPase subunit F/Vma7
MVFLNINNKNYNEKNKNGKTMINTLNELIEGSPDNKGFILYYMEGCGPCNATRPEWDKLKHSLKKFANNNTIAIVDIDQELASKVKDSNKEPSSFPTMRFITNKGNDVENYEDSNIENKDRSIDSFVDWINLKTKEHQRGGKSNKNKNKSKAHRQKGGKWSRKYKRGINCKNPRGFSQRQYCKYSRKK